MGTISYQEFQDKEARAEAQRRRPLRLLVIFLAVFFALQYAWEMSRGSWLERLVIDRATVAPAAWLIDSLWPGQGVQADGHRLVSPQGRLSVLNGCEGLETLFLLVAAILAYPFAWRVRLVGLLLGTLMVYGLNQARLLLLWHAFVHDRALFGLLHGTVLPLVMVAVCLMGFLWFIARHDRRPA
jgi:exosortase/archaeosortase family protein